MATYTIDVRALDRTGRNYEAAGPELAAALTRAVNQVGGVARTAAIRQTALQMGLNISDVRPSISTFRATQSNITFDVVGTGRPISLRAFGAKQTKRGVSARPWGIRRLFRGSFIINSLGGSVYHRVGPKVLMTRGRYKGKYRQQIKKMWGPAIPSVMLQAQVTAAWNRTAAERLPKRIDHEVARAMAKLTVR